MSAPDEIKVPFISKAQLERRAHRTLAYFCKSCLEKPCLTPLAEICNRLRKEFEFQFNFNQDLGLRGGNKVLGRIYFSIPLIAIDKSVDPGGPIWRFTMAHEIGHFVLHRKLFLKSQSTPNEDGLIDDRRTLLPLDRVPKSPKDFLEYQANQYAAALLMPAPTVRMLIMQVQEEIGLSPSRRGYIHLDSQPQNQADFRTIMAQMRLRYQTSYTACKIRLKELGILQEPFEAKHEEIKQISKVIAPIISAVGNNLKSTNLNSPEDSE